MHAGGIDMSMADLAKYTAWHTAGLRGLLPEHNVTLMQNNSTAPNGTGNSSLMTTSGTLPSSSTAVLSHATFRQLHAPYGQSRDRKHGRYAMGWEQYRRNADRTATFLHDGLVEGALCMRGPLSWLVLRSRGAAARHAAVLKESTHYDAHA